MTTDVFVDRLLKEAEAKPVEGWDFTWLGDRISTAPLPWSFEAVVSSHARRSPDLLDMETGGEWLAALPDRPRRTVATEAWPPNVEEQVPGCGLWALRSTSLSSCLSRQRIGRKEVTQSNMRNRESRPRRSPPSVRSR